LQAKDGGPYTINRKTSSRIIIPTLAVSVLGGIQPDKIRPLAHNLAGDGLLQRFMVIRIDRRGAGVDAARDRELEAALNTLALSLTEGEQGALFKFAPEAAVELDAVEEFKTREINRPNTSPAFRQWLDKLPNDYGRVALVFHIIEHRVSPAAKGLFE